MYKTIGRMQVHNWGDNRIMIFGQLIKSAGVKDEDYNLGDSMTDRENISIYDVIETGVPDMLMLHYRGKPFKKHTIGRTVEEYIQEDEYWATVEEMTSIYKSRGIEVEE